MRNLFLHIPELQAATAVVWLVTSCFFAGSAWRSLFGKARDRDVHRAQMFFAGLLFFGFAARWLLFPGSAVLWGLLYIMSIMLAGYALLLIWNGRDRS
jgi:hypothetical protein